MQKIFSIIFGIYISSIFLSIGQQDIRTYFKPKLNKPTKLEKKEPFNLTSKMKRGEFIQLNALKIKPTKKNILEFEKQFSVIINSADKYLEIRLIIDHDHEEIWGDVIENFKKKWQKFDSLHRSPKDVYEIEIITGITKRMFDFYNS